MFIPRRVQSAALAAICLTVGFAASSSSSNRSQNTTEKGKPMTSHAAGTFDVKVTPLPPDDPADPNLGRMSIDKQFHGELEGTSKGQMLTAGTSVKGSGVYVAVEKVTGKLQGRTGTFILHHTGVMTHGVPQLSITVVPDSGTGELTGLSGTMNIVIADGKHSYIFDYTLTPAP